MQLRQETYWLLPRNGRTYRVLPREQIKGQPIPTTWAGVGQARAKELGAVECHRDMVPPYHSIPAETDPWTVEEADGVRHYRLDMAMLVHDGEAENAALADSLRRQRDEKLKESDWAVLALERRIRLAGGTGDGVPSLEENLAQWDAYREALCTLPDSAGFPQEVQWPERPE